MAARDKQQQLEIVRLSGCYTAALSRDGALVVAYWTRMLMAAASVAALTGSAVAQTSGQDTPAPALYVAVNNYVAPPSANDIEWVRTGLAAAVINIRVQ